MIYVDSNIILRYLLDDHIKLSKKAREIIDSENNIFICDGVLAEIVYVLSKTYQVKRKDIKDTLINLINRENIYINESTVIIKSLEIFASKNIDYIDCLLCAYHHVKNKKVETFDKKVLKCLTE